MPSPRAPTRRTTLALLLLLAVLAGAWLLRRLWAPSGPELHELSGPTMGTTYSVKLVAVSLDPEARQHLDHAVRARLDEVVRLMSTYEPESELSRFNRHRSTEPFPVSARTLEVFQVAQRVSELSGGAFDVTVGPLVEAWGFGATDRTPSPPDAAELSALRSRVGYRRVEIDAVNTRLSKSHPETECDLSAIAKGFAVDRIAEALRELGYADFLVEVGGEVRAAGLRNDGSPWRVAIETPDPTARRLHRVVELRDLALATSGDYRNFYESEGAWISHLIDPRSARPIAHELGSVSVLHREGVWADALATALIVLGPDAGWELARREGVAAYFILRRPGGGFRTRITPDFERLVGGGEPSAGSGRQAE